ncbi:MAG: ABC transporter substrate-binding protein [Gammaproteobacteria bacterium]|nr:ABC transporter substrate-binding protein [Gammaproteobacteria bacterium]
MGRKLIGGFLAAVLAVGVGAQAASAETVLRARLDSGLKQLDPIWTTAYVVRNHGFLVYDTLFGLDENYNVQPQMVDTWEVSDDAMTYTFTLREGLKWHDGTAVSAEDCVASIKRWAARDGMGQKLMEATENLEVIDENTFQLTLNQPFGLVLQALAKLTSNVPFMMKKEHAMTDPNEQVTEVIGSGPFKFVKEEFKPGVSATYVKNEDYVPRSEPASNTAGGKVPNVDRVELLWIPDDTSAMNALIAGELDYHEVPAPDLVPMLEQAENVKVEIFDELGNQTVLRMNHNQPPFDNQKIRQAILWATNQDDSLRAAVGDPSMYKKCGAMFVCGTPLETAEGSEALLAVDQEQAQALLKEAGYNNEPIVILHPTDDVVISNQTLVTAQALRGIGMNVDLQAMDWATLVSRRAVNKPTSEGGWHIFQTWFNGPDFLNPVEHMAVGATCDEAWFGWPCDEQIEKLRTEYAQEPDPDKQKEIARQVQQRAYEIVTYVPLGTYFAPRAYRSDRLEGLVKSPISIFWNVSIRQ